jgi:hypothetical protein
MISTIQAVLDHSKARGAAFITAIILANYTNNLRLEGRTFATGRGGTSEAIPPDILSANPLGTGIEPIRTLRQPFARFWELYPKKRSKGDAEREWHKLNPPV